MKSILHKTTALTLCFFLLAGCSEQAKHENIYSGYIEGRFLQIAPPQSGWLTRLNVEQGDRIEPGQTLFSLDKDQQQILLAQSQAKTSEAKALVKDSQKGGRPEELAVIQAEIKAQQARVQYTLSEKKRWLKTAAHDYSSKSARDNAIANYDIAVATLEQLKRKLAQAKLAARTDQIAAREAALQQSQLGEDNNRWLLSQRDIKAVQAGEVDEIYYRAGEFVPAGKPVLSVLLNNQKKVRFFVPQNKLSQLRLGQAVRVAIDGQDRIVTATIDFIAKDAEFTPPVIYSKEVRDKLVFLVEAALPDTSGLRVGQPVDVRLQ